MGYWRCVLLMLILVGMSLETSAENANNDDDRDRTKRNVNSDCDSEYLELSASHTRCLTDNANAVAVSLGQAAMDHVVQLHNQYRTIVQPTASNMMKMTWDSTLAKTAEKWAMQCLVGHDEIYDRAEPAWPMIEIGQNVGSGHKSFDIMLGNFFAEKKKYNYTYGGDYVLAAGHYYQMVSHDTTRVGCAEVRCPQTSFAVLRVCNYAPALDAGTPPYKNGEPCADCPGYCDQSQKLCDCEGKLCYNGGEIDSSTCGCTCNSLWTGDNCEQTNCFAQDPFQACRTGELAKKDCGTVGSIIEDPNMCPHLCGICPEREKPCEDIQCRNGGILNTDTCECQCKGELTGRFCEICPPKDHRYCTVQWLKKSCDKAIRHECPIYCGFCETSCKRCENQGYLDTTDCSCLCPGEYSGPQCEICPEKDDSICSWFSKEECNTEPFTFSAARAFCPYLCEIC